MDRPLQRLRTGLTPARLRLFLAALFVALAAPTAILVTQTYRQLKWEAFHQYRTLADELAQRIDADVQRLLDAEEARGYADYQFLTVAGDPAQSRFVQRSPLAAFPVESDIPGLAGYFQVGADGGFSTPLLPEGPTEPARVGLGADELAQRRALRDRLLAVLTSNQLVQPRQERKAAAGLAARSERRAPGAPAPAASAPAGGEVQALERDAPAQQAFDALNAPVAQGSAAGKTGRLQLQDLKLDDSYQEQMKRAPEPPPAALARKAEARTLRKEQGALLESAAAGSAPGRDAASGDVGAAPQRVRIFESEVAPFEVALLDSGHFVLFRKVWRDGRRTIQGALIEQAPFIDGLIGRPFRETSLAQMSDLVVAYQGGVLRAVTGAAPGGYGGSAQELEGTLLHQARLTAPLGGLQLVWTIKQLPAGPGARIVVWSSVVLAAMLLLGFLALERLGMKQILLARQQRDFVSAVSHELKTPLTSIRMYGEMLREGWVAEDKKREYYSFIHDESERLSRLIANVLQLARLERNDLSLQIKPATVQALMDLLRSRLQGQVARAGFELACDVEPACAARELDVDGDAFTQILINLVDNALKFAAGAARKRVEITARPRGEGAVAWAVRDFGPGVPRAQMRRIFELFYRPGNELTRETAGTGIGLALARQLARAMGGGIDVLNREPGAEFELVLPARR